MNSADFEKKFKPEKNFKGKFLGYRAGLVYQLGADGVGYYPENVLLPNPEPVSI